MKRVSLIPVLFLLLLLFTSISQAISPTEQTTSNPIILQSLITPTKVRPGDTMTITTTILDAHGIEKVETYWQHEHGYDTITLTLDAGTNYFGTWKGTWTVHDTIEKQYNTTIRAYSHSGYINTIDLPWYDPLVPWWNVDWSYRKKITLNSTQVPSDQTNFPVLISLTDTDLRDDAQNDGDDIAFTNSSGTTKLNHEIEYFDGTTGELTAWVNVTSLSSSSDTELYMYYGNNGCSSQETIAGVWDSQYKMVQHLNETPANDMEGHFDSTSNNNDGTPKDFNGDADSTTDATGKIAGADRFQGDNNAGDYINCGNDASMDISTKVTVSAWVKPDAGCYGYYLSKNHYSRYSSFIDENGNNFRTYIMGTSYQTTFNFPTDSWTHVATVYDQTSTALIHYINGVRKQSFTVSSVINSAGLDLVLGKRCGAVGDCGAGNYFYNGFLDEVRFSTSAQTSHWIKTSYNSQINATDGGFFSLDGEEIAIPTQPSLSSPSNNGSTNDVTPLLQWTNGNNADYNTLLLDDESDLTDGDEHINITLSSSASSYQINSSKTLTEGQWYWKIIANNSNGANSSETWCFIVDTTPPHTVGLKAPYNNNATDSNSVTFSWNQTLDNTSNTSQVSDIQCYQLLVDDNSDFSSPTVNENTSTNDTYSLTKTVSGEVYWRVRAWDQAGNPGAWSEIRDLTIINFLLSTSSSSFNILKGNSQTVIITVELDYGNLENITLTAEWSETLSDITTSFNVTTRNASSWTSTLTISAGADAPTEEYTCYVNATTDSGVTKTVTITVDVNSMVIDLSDPVSFSMMRDDIASTTLSVKFLIGGKETVTLSGDWYESSPTGVTASISPTTGTPSYDAKLTFDTNNHASAGTYIYRVTATGGGMTITVDETIVISTNLTLTVDTDDISFEKGQEIHISGTATDPHGNTVQSGTTTITLTNHNWIQTITTPITNGQYSTSYYITFDKPDGDWIISTTATDIHGHTTPFSQNTSISVITPESIGHYIMKIISPPTHQLFKRGETVTFSISLLNQDEERIEGADVKAWFSSGEQIDFSEGSLGIYSANYDVGYQFPIGNQSLYVEGKKSEGGKVKVGFHYIDFKIAAITPQIELLTPKPGDLIETGETINIQIKATYPDGTPVQEGIITMQGPDGETLIFTRTKEPGVYTTSYTPNNQQKGNWTLQITLQDAFGNMATLQGTQVDIVDSKIFTLLQRYWWATLICIIMITVLLGYLIQVKLQKSRYVILQKEITQLEQLKRKNAVMYFTNGEITRETYDRLSQDYEKKIARLSKKERMLYKRLNSRGGKQK